MYDVAIWWALGLGFAAVFAALVFLGVRVLQAWRDVKRVRRHLFKALDRLTETAELAAEKAGRAADTAELRESLGRLRLSLARLALLREAFDEARAPIRLT